MRRMLLVLLSVVGLSGMTSAAFGVPAQSRIVGGTTAPPGSWPAIAAISADGVNPFNGQFCGGTLIDPSWVLTAAHCTFNPPATPLDVMDVWLGIDTLSNHTLAVPAGAQKIDVAQVIRHPGYVDNGSFRDDVALLRLQTPAVLGATPPVSTMDLVSPLDDQAWDPGSAARVAGWGVVDTGTGTAADDLQQVDISMLSPAGCGSYGAAFVPSMMLCAGELVGGKDSCQGDSGGPLTVPATTTGQRVLVGAVSWGTGCALPNFPGIYAHLPNYRSFIYNTIGVAPPGQPQNATAVFVGSDVHVSWQAPAAIGGRPLLGYEVRATLGGQVAARAVVPAGTTTATLPGLSPTTQYQYDVAAASAAGLGPSIAASQRPFFAGGLSLSGIARVGHEIGVDAPTFVGATGSATLQWQSCDESGVTCVDIAGATGGTYRPTMGDIGRRLRVSASAGNAVGLTTATSAAFPVTRAAFALTRTRATRVTQRTDGTSLVSLGIRTDRLTNVKIKVLDAAGRVIAPRRAVSRLDGRVPVLVSNRLIGTLAPTDVHTLIVGIPGRVKGPFKTVRIVIRATNPEGTVVEKTFPVRVRR